HLSPGLAYGGRLSLLVGSVTVLAAVVVGALLGGLAGYLGGALDDLLMRMTDILFAFPAMLLAILLAAILGPGVANVVVALTLATWPPMARTVRAEVLSLQARDFVSAAVAQGARPRPLPVRPLLRN